jgi:Bifunctional DNA primase/polymerase, N-terminal
MTTTVPPISIEAWNAQPPALTAQQALEVYHWSVIPLDTDKKPIKTGGYHPDGNPKRLGWKPFQERLATVQELRRWARNYQPAAWAVITGKTSNLILLDFDGERGQETLQKLGLLPHVRTGSGGFHVYFSHPGWNVKTLNNKSSKDKPWAKLYPGLDIRADGGYAAFCGRNTSGPYEWLREPVLDALSILPDELRIFLGLMNPPDIRSNSRDLQDILIDKALARVGMEGRDNAGFWLACQLRDNRFSQSRAESALLAYACRVPNTNTKGQVEPFTDEDARAKVRSAYNAPAREAWQEYKPGPAAKSDGNGNNGHYDSIPPVDTTDDTTQEGSKSKRESVSLQLVRMAEQHVEVFRDTGGARFAKVAIDNHAETMMLSEKGSFRLWLHGLYNRETGLIPNSNALTEAITTFAARAQFIHKKEAVYLRVAYIEETNTIYLDMANEAYQVIKIDERGWDILDKSPVCFRRSNSMKPLPTPVRGGSVDDLREFVNVRDEDWILIKAWVLSVIMPYGLEFGEYPVLNLNGGQGTAKTSAATRLRSVFDPSFAPLRKKPKDDQTFAIMAHNNFVVALDNLSHISTELSDSMCTLSTGQGDAYRTLYTDADETVFQAKRPQVFTGIEQLATRGDLLDRCILVTLRDINEAQRIDSTELNKLYNAAHPRILGAFLDCASHALKHRASVKLNKKPRLADFAMFIVAAEPLIGESGKFIEALRANKEEGVAVELEASPVASTLIQFMQDQDMYTSSATDLLEALATTVNHNPLVVDSKAWPKDARALSAQLKRLARSLRSRQIYIQFSRHNTGSVITITRHDESDESDAKVTQPCSKNDEPCSKSDANESQKNDFASPPIVDTSNSNPSVTQSVANNTTFFSVGQTKKEEEKKEENTKHHTFEETGNLLHFASPEIEEQLTRVQHAISQARMTHVHWMERQSGFISGLVKPAEYLRRLRVCLESSDPKRIESAREEMDRHLHS